MTKDEMKDKISFALKDPILQQGFKIICKNIAELEKENTELKEKISFLLSCKNCPENKRGWICAKEYEDKCLAQKIEFIKELEKENAELQEQCSILADSNVCSSTCSETKKQLTKAKKIIRNCLNLWNNVMTEETIRAFIKEAEQFLNSEVEQ